MNRLAPVALALLALATPLAPPARGDDKPDNKRKVDEAVAKGLEYLASRQHKDGSWAAAGDRYAAPLTALCGMSFLMEGSTLDAPAKAAGFEEYTQYYYAQVAYGLGDEGYAKLFPDSKPEERLTWGKYRDKAFETILTGQAKGGEWKGVGVGPEYTTACYLTVLQLDKGEAPVYQR